MINFFANIIAARVNYLKGVILLVFLINCGALLHAQIIVPKNTIYLYGQVTNSINGGPVKNQVLTVTSDTIYNPDFYYVSEVKTDAEGYFYDTIGTYVNKGALKVITTDYLGIHRDTTLYFRFNWSEENFLFANFILPVEPPTVILQANFYYLKDPSGQNISEFQFFDITNSTAIVWREWNFGDGNFSSEVNPVHVYTEPGIYKVKLSVSIQPTPFSIPYLTEIVKIINVSVKSYFNLGGHVKAGYFPIDAGDAYLYKIENNDIVMIDTAIFNDTLGYYCFFQLIEGEYLVRADISPESVLFNQFVNTYYADKPVWTEADTIFHYSDSFEYDIQLIPISSMNAGTGSISGFISFGFDPGKEMGVPAANVEILLFNSNQEPVGCSHSNNGGYFSFSGLELTTYFVHAEITGKYTFPVEVTLTVNYPDINEVNIVIGNYSINGSVNLNSINESESIRDIGELYPNPVQDRVNLDITVAESGILYLSILDECGKVILTRSRLLYAGTSLICFEVGDLPSGVYIAKIGFHNQQAIKKLIKN